MKLPFEGEGETMKGRLDRLHWTLAAILGIAIIYFVLTPYQYRTWIEGNLVRINRFTGDAEILMPREGWRPLRRATADDVKKKFGIP